MVLIYEKKGQEHFAVGREDLPQSREKGQISYFEKKDFAHYVQKPVCERKIKERVRAMRKRRHRLRKTALAAVSAVFCIAVLDSRLFAGRIFSEVKSLSKNCAVMLLETLAEDPQKDGMRTLYTMEYTDERNVLYVSAKGDGQISADTQEENPTHDDVAVTVDGTVSPSSLDGVNYYPITEMDLSAQSVFAISNGTSFRPDITELSSKKPASLEGFDVTDGPLVLIVHTHGGECYSEHEGMYPEGESTRTTDESKNVVRVGSEIAKTLSAFGITALHCQTQHDKESFINAYGESAIAVKSYLEEYPSIRFVVDVHRDAIIRDDGESIKAVKRIAGEDYAQIMFVVGTNELGHNHPDWRENLSLAMTLQKSIEDTYPGLCRSINLRDVPFNQQLSTGYLLLEVGTCANTLDEALLSARAFGENLARVIYQSGE